MTDRPRHFCFRPTLAMFSTARRPVLEECAAFAGWTGKNEPRGRQERQENKEE
jgi:hypothetical protein